VSDGAARRRSGRDAFAADALLADREVDERERRREQRLVEAACRGEESAIEALYRTHFDTIYRYVFLRLGSPTAAEDVTSQVFLGMVRGLGRYRDEGKPFVAWLYGMARKQIAFYQRGQSRALNPVDLDAAEELVAESAGPHASAEERELRLAIAHALSKVPEGQREVIMLRYILSMSVADTAAIVGRTEGAVKQLQLRGLATLKGLLGHRGLDLV
jgi:RNA polymerase sigma-70 factor (ECF subfamily)